MTLTSLLMWYIMLQAQGQWVLASSSGKRRRLETGSRWAPAAVSAGSFPKEGDASHGHSWVLVESARGTVLLDGLWASPFFSHCQLSFCANPCWVGIIVLSPKHHRTLPFSRRHGRESPQPPLICFGPNPKFSWPTPQVTSWVLFMLWISEA